MFVQYSFVQRRGQAIMAEHRPLELTPSLTVAAGIGCMVLTACAYLLG